MGYENQILTAIDIMINKAIESLDYDKTIVGTIREILDPVLGEYRVQYQDSIFTAYSESENVYKIGMPVYIMMPSNNINKHRLIIGSAGKGSSTYLSSLSGEEKYVKLGNNIINYSESIVLDTYLPADTKHFTPAQLNIKEEDINFYKQESDYIIIAAKFKTNLEKEQQIGNGNYGIVVDAKFKNEETGVEYVRSYTLDVNSMLGQPYKSFKPTRQYVIFPIEGKDFVGIEKLTAFSQNFPMPPEDKRSENHSIEITDLEFFFSEALTEEELNGVTLRLIAPEGSYFVVGDVKKTIQAIVKKNGNTVKNIDGVEYYWFIQDLMVDQESEYYSPLAGIGWKCLNIKSGRVEDENDFVSGSDIFTVTNENCRFYENVIKCVAMTDDFTSSKNITIINKNKEGSKVSIQCSEESSFPFKDISSITLTGYIGEEVVGNQYECVWAAAADDRLTQTLDGNTAVIQTNPNIAERKVTYSLTVKNEDAVIGTANITLVNATTQTDFTVILNNADVVYKYNTEGVSPASNQTEKKDRVVPKAITYTVFDKNGREIGDTAAAKLSMFSARWYWPVEHTMVVPIMTSTNVETIDGIDYYYADIRTEEYLQFGYTIATRYNIANTNNKIILKLKYRGVEQTISSSLLFVKEGEQGTNGTKYVVRIVPTLSEIEEVSNYYLFIQNKQFYYLDKDRGTIAPRTSIPLNLEIWNQGVGTATSGDWQILQGKVEIEDNNLKPTEYTTDTATIIQASVQLPDQKRCYASMPISFVNSTSTTEGYIVEGGWNEAIYSPSGENVQYDNSQPFVVKRVDLNTGELSEALNASWTPSWNIESAISGEEVNIQPPRKLSTGTDNYVLIEVDGIEIYYSVHLYANRYSMAAMNEWDGNNIEIGETEILAAQIAAGKKNNDNSFTGVAIGETFQGGNSNEIGLFGYNGGNRTVFINARNGSFHFGGQSENYLDFNTTNGNFDLNVKKQFYVGNGSNDYIQFANGKLTINATSGFYVGSNSNNYIQLANGNLTMKTTNEFYVGSGNNSISFNGSALNIKVNSMSIGGQDTASAISSAQSTASSAASTASQAKQDAADAAKTATNFLTYDNSGLYIHRSGDSYNSGYNTQITSNAINFRNGTTILNTLSSAGINIYGYQGNSRSEVSINSDGMSINYLANVEMSYGEENIGSFSKSSGISFGKLSMIQGQYDYPFRVKTNGSTETMTLKIRNPQSGIYTYCDGYQIYFYVDGTAIGYIGPSASKPVMEANNLKATGTFNFGFNAYTCEVYCNDGVYNYTVSGGNLALDNNHRMGVKSGSSKRFKHDIKSIKSQLNPSKLLSIPVIQFKYNNDYLSNTDERYQKDIPGFIAEDIDKIYPIACNHDSEGRPNDWEARYIIPPMLALIQEQHKRITALEECIREIKGEK